MMMMMMMISDWLIVYGRLQAAFVVTTDGLMLCLALLLGAQKFHELSIRLARMKWPSKDGLYERSHTTLENNVVSFAGIPS